MNKESLVEKVLIIKIEEITKGLLEVDYHIELDKNLNEIGLDSLKSIRLVVALEDEFQIEFDDSELLLENFLTVNSIAHRISIKMK